MVIKFICVVFDIPNYDSISIQAEPDQTAGPADQVLLITAQKRNRSESS